MGEVRERGRVTAAGAGQQASGVTAKGEVTQHMTWHERHGAEQEPDGALKVRSRK